MVRGFVYPATAMRRGFGRLTEKTLQRVFPGTRQHAVALDFDQYLGGRIIRGLSQQNLTLSDALIVGSSKAGE